MKRKALFYTLALYVSFFWCGIVYYGMIGMQDAARGKYYAVKASVIAKVARIGGYERPQPKLSDLTVRELCEGAALKEEINKNLFCALVKVESNNRDFVFSSAGAIGPAQVMPANSKFCGLSSPTKLLNPALNIKCGAKLFKEQLLTYNNDVIRALYGYNASPAGVRKVISCGHNIQCMGQYSETYHHAQKVLASLATDIKS